MTRTLPLLALLLAALPVFAHHSGAMFEDKKSVTLNGTVKAFQWTNPHCFIQMLVPGKDGSMTEWSVELGAPFEVIRTGFKPKTLQPGDKITVVIHPMRDGSNAGLFVSAVTSDGKQLGKPAQ
jgi:Family of unknown function (DUF6152)